jgi:hypothetical protein
MRTALATGLVLALATLPLSAAPAGAGVDALYDCQHVTYHSIFPNTPLNGYPCSGPGGPSAGGSVLDLSTGTVYHCGSTNGSVINGAMYVFGNLCSP